MKFTARPNKGKDVTEEERQIDRERTAKMIAAKVKEKARILKEPRIERTVFKYGTDQANYVQSNWGAKKNARFADLIDNENVLAENAFFTVEYNLGKV